VIDAHCHLNSERLDTGAETLVAEAEAAGVEGIVMAGVDSRCWRSQLALADRWPDRVFPVFGLHPQAAAELSDADIARELRALEDLLAARRPVALGELGLDRLGVARRERLNAQIDAFEQQLKLACAHDLPVVLHLLKSDALALELLRSHPLPRQGGLVHSFSGAAPFARALVDLGLHISFSGTLTLPQSRRLREAAAAVPPERLLIETDSPDQLPYGARRSGEHRMNRPAWLGLIADALADARGESPELIRAQTAANARALFGLPLPGATPAGCPQR